MKVLIADDEKLIRDVIKEYCLGSGYEALEAVNGIEAVEKAKDADILAGAYHYFSYASRKITLGQNFIQGVSPTIYLNGEEIPLNSLAWTSLDKGNKNFSLYDLLLEEGNYIFKARKNGFWQGLLP